MSNPILSVITVTHNHASYLERYAESLLAEQEFLALEIIVIDNCSDDHSAEIISKYPQIILHINHKRRGFSANNNYGMAIASGQYLLLLNPDIFIKPGALLQLLRFMEENPQVGLCGAQLLFPSGSIQPSVRRFPTILSTLVRRTPLRWFLKNSAINQHHLMFDLNHQVPQPVDWLLGACLMVRREILAEVGPLDEGYFLYVEDIDWARRIHQTDWDVYYVPTAQIYHYHLAVSDRNFLSRYTWFHCMSMIRYIRKYWLLFIPGLGITKNQFSVWETTRK